MEWVLRGVRAIGTVFDLWLFSILAERRAFGAAEGIRRGREGEVGSQDSGSVLSMRARNARRATFGTDMAIAIPAILHESGSIRRAW
jgi:hypothetical protein